MIYNKVLYYFITLITKYVDCYFFLSTFVSIQYIFLYERAIAQRGTR